MKKIKTKIKASIIFILLLTLFSSFLFANSSTKKSSANDFKNLPNDDANLYNALIEFIEADIPTSSFDQNKKSFLLLKNAILDYQDKYPSELLYKNDITRNNSLDKMLVEIDKSLSTIEDISSTSYDCTQQIQNSKNIIKNEAIKYYYSTNALYKQSGQLLFFLTIVLSFIVILVIIIFIQYQKLEKKNASIEKEKIQSEVETNAIVNVQENERERIARELHDTVTQDIRIIKLFLHKLEPLCESNKEESEIVLKIDSVEEQNLKNIHSIIKNLMPPELKYGDFYISLNELCTEAATTYNISCTFYSERNEMIKRISSEKKLHIFRIIQEAITNAAKHASPKEISVVARDDEKSSSIVFFVTDDGTGFTESKSSQDTHFGIRSMEARAKIIGAKLEIQSTSETGTEVRLQIPVK